MIDTYQALVVTVLALLPGALYTYAVERQTGRWGANFTDRLVRFVAASAVLHAVFAAATYAGYRDLIRNHRLADGKALPPWVWLAVLGYVMIPVALGDVAGRAIRNKWRGSSVLSGPSPAPRAWDHLFAAAGRSGYVRLRLLDPGSVSAAGTSGAEVVAGRWVIGTFKGDSYAAGYPEAQDLYLADSVRCDPATGEFDLDRHQNVQLTGIGILVRWEQVAYLEFIAA